MVSAALVVCLALVIPAATGSDSKAPDRPSLVVAPTQALATGVSSPLKFTPITSSPSRPKQDGFQAFAVEEDLKISPKKRAATPAAVPAAAPSNAATADSAPAAPAAGRTSSGPTVKTTGLPGVAGSGARAGKAIQLKLEPGADPHQAWNDYFNGHADVSPADVAQTADVLMHKHKYAELAAMIEEAIVHDQGQPWMYGALEIAIQAAGSPPEEIGAGIDVGD